MLITRIHWCIFWPGWGVGSLFFVFSVFLSGLAGLWAMASSFYLFCSPFGFPFVYFLCTFWNLLVLLSQCICFLSIKKKKKKLSNLFHVPIYHYQKGELKTSIDLGDFL